MTVKVTNDGINGISVVRSVITYTHLYRNRAIRKRPKLSSLASVQKKETEMKYTLSLHAKGKKLLESISYVKVTVQKNGSTMSAEFFQ